MPATPHASINPELPHAGGRTTHRTSEIACCFAVDDASKLPLGRASVHFDVCPVEKTIVGFELSFDRLPIARPATVAVPKRARKGKSAPRKADTWPMPGMPRTVVINSPEFEAPTFRDAAMKSGEAGSDRKG